MGGFIDGEGTITICTTAKTKTYVSKIAVSNTNKASIDLFEKEFGGKVRLRNYKKKHKNWKPCYEWMLTNQKAYKVIKLLQPYLKLKNRQAHLVLKVERVKFLYKKVSLRWNPDIKIRVHATMQRIKDKVQILNKRGL